MDKTSDVEVHVTNLAMAVESTASSPNKESGGNMLRATIQAILPSGELWVVVGSQIGSPIRCDILESAFAASVELNVGDEVLVLCSSNNFENGCVLGRIGRYAPPETKLPDQIVIAAGEHLTLRCGDSSIDLRKDGKLMVRGNDVLTRAKRTQRIKAGTNVRRRFGSLALLSPLFHVLQRFFSACITRWRHGLAAHNSFRSKLAVDFRFHGF